MFREEAVLVIGKGISNSSTSKKKNRLDEVMVGQLVNGYAKSEFVLDAHPPLGKMILAGVSSLSNYRGSFDFEDIGE